MTVPFYDVGASQASAATAIEAAVARVVRSGWYVLGPEVAAFEAAWAARCGVASCVGVGNGLDALRLILLGLGIGPGDEVLVPAHTFVATWLAVTAAGATPVGVDVLPGSGLLDPGAAAAAVGPRTAAVIGVHLYGQPVDADALAGLCASAGLAFVEDAAQAHGAEWQGVPAGSLGTAAAFSFYPGKNLGALGDGGAVTTGDVALAERIRRLANYGSSARYVHDVAGTNSRLDELQAAVLTAKLDHLPTWNGRRAELAQRYRHALGDVPGIELLEVDPRASSAWHLFPIRVDDRDRLAAHLAADGIGTSIHYPVPPHRSGAFSATHGAGCFPVADDWSARCLSLPLGPALTDADHARVVRATTEASSARWAAAQPAARSVVPS